MAPMVFKTYHDLDEYLKECDMIYLEMLAAAIVEEPPEEVEEKEIESKKNTGDSGHRRQQRKIVGTLTLSDLRPG